MPINNGKVTVEKMVFNGGSGQWATSLQAREDAEENIVVGGACWMVVE